MCRLRRIGIGDAREVMIYSPLSVNGQAMLPKHEVEAQTRVIADYFQRAPRLDMHNGIAYDSIVLWRHGMPVVDEHIYDSLVAHQVGPTSELPHALDFLASVYTDAPRWKDDVKHSLVHRDEVHGTHTDPTKSDESDERKRARRPKNDRMRRPSEDR